MGRWLSDEDIQELEVALALRVEHRVVHVLTESLTLIMAANDDMTSALASLTTSVDAAVAAITGASSGLTADQAAAATAQVQAESDKLNAAVTPPA